MADPVEVIARSIWEVWRMSEIAPDFYHDIDWAMLCRGAEANPKIAAIKETALSEARTALSALEGEGQVVGKGWHPIATAPKDGTDVLLWRQPWPSGRQDPPIVAGWFSNGEEADWSSHEAPNQWLDGVPTHWMKLPDPPEPR